MAVTDLLTPTGLFYYLLVPTVILWYAYFRYQRRRLYELAAKIPGPEGLPLIGSALEFMGSANDIYINMWNRSLEYSSETPVKVWIGPRLMVFLQDPRDVEVILSSNVHLDKSTEYRYFQPWFGNGLLISTGDHWRSHRKLIAPTFHLNVLKSFIDLFNHNSRGVVEKLRKEVGHEFDAHEYMSEATVEILLETAMGVSKKEQQSGFEYAMAVMKMCDILHLRHTKFWLRPETIFRMTSYFSEQTKLLGIIHGLTKRVIKNKKLEFNKGVRGSLASYPGMKAETAKAETSTAKTTKVEDSGMSYGQSAGLKDDLDVDDNDVGEKKRLAFLDLLIESAQNGVVLTDQDIKEEVDTIMFEGHDTTAAGSSFFLCMMGLHQDIQDKVVEELDQIFGDSDRPATFQDTLEMKYLERCMLETLRMYPPVPIIARQLREEVKMASTGVTIPAGCTVVVATVKLHRNEEIYPNPTVFNPDNFLPEKSANRHYYAFVPFSAGPRSCVGRKYAMLKLKILLSTILRNYRIKATIPEKDFKLTADIILKRADGFKISLEPRKKSGLNITSPVAPGVRV
ncbi:cytochrome P450 4g15 isoform X2 [Thrips palmi]|nr:cytochrome P450 4g15 isoform X2 [Thrips palmi]